MRYLHRTASDGTQFGVGVAQQPTADQTATNGEDQDAGAQQHQVCAILPELAGWTCWLGHSTGQWWALPPADYQCQHLLEAVSAEQLIQLIRHSPLCPRPARAEPHRR